MKLKDLLQYLHNDSIHLDENPVIQSIEMDSREVKAGSLFICIKGFTVDGHHYVKQAVQKGAAAILAEEFVEADVPVVIVKDTKRAMAVLADVFYGQPTHKLNLIGVTGTNGKTTTTHIIEHILNKAQKKNGLIGTMYIKIGEQTYSVKNTTPESLTLQKTFKQMVDQKVDTAVMEVSSHALHMGRVHGCDYDVAVFTNLSQDHLDYHETMEAYRQAKGLLFAQLGNRFDHKRPKFAILNLDDPATEHFSKMTTAHIISYGIEQDSDVKADNIQMTSAGTVFDLYTPKGQRKVCMKLIGKFSVYNVLAAVSACLASNIDFETIVRAIEDMEGVRGRFEVVNEGQDFTVIVDYAHTPDSLENVLTTVKQFAQNRTFVVVGCGGDRDKTKRPLMAEIATKYADESIFTSDNPRSENPIDILQDMEAGAKDQYYHSIVNREKAIYFAIANAKPGDVVLIAGKGHETYQQIGQEIFNFDDREVAKSALLELKLNQE
ncbi:UDP-N-acetylmuramoyl-L-alanyl-D-glutamate--2,6-diaminopimelate ligase [Metabacillus arenae]|uniref:UDP-N-acetylmuramoyl-L-alanyl-D-glutamate--2,6-diaminopimelate ligase n=1 Tax=Metabacillus arenae TaxID=2771434 RepID=A0A926NEC1_9BACI|nr:UDP-N-acetylmuramoyl-L-alanyl-D-glutamate--2,6-diaminopimelate ligase [Metabacillus arenae]MBD1379929.1 UDP-N-acetylmuramoyl-L-alanyl-D-glutamate--2,6-diaminopimelate ligase [Metabacillus arenae]